MSLLQSVRSAVTPWTLLLFGVVAPLSWAATSPVGDGLLDSYSGISVTTDDTGDMRLRVRHDLLTGRPDVLKEGLLEVLLDDQKLLLPPAKVDLQGNIHYLVSLGENEGGKEINLTPVPNPAMVDVASKLATGAAALLTVGALDAFLHRSSRDFLHLASPDGESSNSDTLTYLTRAYGRNAVLQATATVAEGLTDEALTCTLPASGLTGDSRTLNSLWRSAFLGGVGSLLQRIGGAQQSKKKSDFTVGDFVAESFRGGAYGQLFKGVHSLHKGALSHSTDWSENAVDRAARVAVIAETAAALLTSSSTLAAGAARGGNATGEENYFATVLLNSLASNSRKLLEQEVKRDGDGDTLPGRDLLVGLLTFGGAGVSYQIGDKLMGGGRVFANTWSVESGVSIGKALKNLTATAIDERGNSLGADLLVAGAGLAGVVTLHELSRYLDTAPSLYLLGKVSDWGVAPLFRNLVIGMTVHNSGEWLNLLKDHLIKPYWAFPAVDRLSLSGDHRTAALRLRGVPSRSEGGNISAVDSSREAGPNGEAAEAV